MGSCSVHYNPVPSRFKFSILKIVCFTVYQLKRPILDKILQL